MSDSNKKVKITREKEFKDVPKKDDEKTKYTFKISPNTEISVGNDQEVTDANGKKLIVDVKSNFFRDKITVKKCDGQELSSPQSFNANGLLGYKWPTWLSVALLLASLLVGAWYFFFKNKKESEEEGL